MRNPRSSVRGYIRGAEFKDDYDVRATKDGMDEIVRGEDGRTDIVATSVTVEEAKRLYDVEYVPVYSSDVAPLGKPFRISVGVLNYTKGIYMHPTDYYWFKFAEDPWRAHRLSEGWIYRRIDQMGDEAIAKLDAISEGIRMERYFDDLTKSIEQAALHLLDIGTAAEDLQKSLESTFFHVEPSFIEVIVSRVRSAQRWIVFSLWDPAKPVTNWDKVKDWFRR